LVRRDLIFGVSHPDAARTPAPARSPLRILVLCTGNSARSQIAEALLASLGAGRVEAESAGSRPAARVNPYAVEVLRAHGLAWEGRTPKSIDEMTGRRFHLVITVCDNARDACPYFPGAHAQVHWGLPDPAEATDPGEARVRFAETYDALLTRVRALLALPLESLEPGELQRRAQAVHEPSIDP
jgi:protein-tyrosine-phosphatase